MVRFRIYFKVLAHRDLLLNVQAFIAVLAGKKKKQPMRDGNGPGTNSYTLLGVS